MPPHARSPAPCSRCSALPAAGVGDEVTTGSQVKAVASDMQVIVEAPADKMAQIEAFITELDDPQGREIVIKTIKLPGADVTQIAGKLSNAFRAKPNVVARLRSRLAG